MAGVEFHMDYQGIGKILRSPSMGDAVMDAAIAVADNLNLSPETSVIIDRYVTDRRAASLTIIDRDPTAIEAKYGKISAAVDAAGLDFKGQ